MKVSEIPVGTAPKPLEFAHFPTRWQTVLWRNLGLVPDSRLAAVLGIPESALRTEAVRLGLEPDSDPEQTALWLERGYLTVIRRNWELLPYSQILQLLDWTPDKLASTLKEDDFMWHKMGKYKPAAEQVRWTKLSPEEERRTAEIRRFVLAERATLPRPSAKPFDFLKHFGKKQPCAAAGKDSFGLKMVYPYSLVYGDPLLQEDPLPEGLFSDYAASGVNAVWLQGTLYTLVPWLGEDLPQSARWQERLANLRKLAAKSAKYGVRIYLYLNEPRCMPHEFFRKHPDWAGSTEDVNMALCITGTPVLEMLSDGVERLFREVPELGGVFTISQSENLTHCKSRGPCTCPRCRDREPAALIAEVNAAISRGAHRANPQAKVIAWSWAWSREWDARVFELLPKDVGVMAVSETALETDCLGVKGEVLDYSISKVGPGAPALRLWKLASAQGIHTTAKVQVNATWELSAVPYIPVPGLVERHLKNLSKAGVSDLMLGWTLGGYPGGNLELLGSSKKELAERKFGPAAKEILAAWNHFEHAFETFFPFHLTDTIYTAPQNFGPMSLFWAEPTGRRATMIGFPYDDLRTWSGNFHYPADIFEKAFGLLSAEWREGVKILEEAKPLVPPELTANWNDLYSVASAAETHFTSTWNQIRFVRLRDAGKDTSSVIRDEMETVRRLLKTAGDDSRIGFEASNHYFYTRNDLFEKLMNCRHLLDHSAE